jgi:hypothetical protein
MTQRDPREVRDRVVQRTFESLQEHGKPKSRDEIRRDVERALYRHDNKK